VRDYGRRITRPSSARVQHVESIRECARIRHRRPGADDREIISNDIGDHQRHDSARGRRGKPPTLDRRKMLADSVQLMNRCATFEQPSHCVLLIGESEIVRRQRHERRGASRQKHDQQVVIGSTLCNLQRAARSRDTALIRNWMSCIEPRCFRWQRLRLTWSDADSGSHADSDATYELCQHWPRGLANGDDVDCRRFRLGASDRRFGKRGPDERRRIRCTNSCTEDLL